MTPRSFGDVWAEAEATRGMVRYVDMEELYKRACAVAPGHMIIEIGCWRGRSTIVLASSGRTMWTIDPMEVGGWLNITEVDIAALRANLSRYSNVVWMRKTTDDVPDPKQIIGLLLIDGDHLPPWPEKDYVRFAPHLADKACVAWHDYPSAAGVVSALDRFRASSMLEGFTRVGTTMFCSHVAPTRRRKT